MNLASPLDGLWFLASGKSAGQRDRVSDGVDGSDQRLDGSYTGLG